MDVSVVARFYDELAPRYHLLYADWQRSVERQGAALTALLNDFGIAPGSTVHDAACGIGTQAIGLSHAGYRVSASDCSPNAVERARRELDARGLEATLSVADMRDLSTTGIDHVHAVLACDNAISHLMSDDEILIALREFHRRLHEGGVAVITVRDFDAAPRRNPDIFAFGHRTDDDARVLPMQVLDWDSDGAHFDMRLYFVHEASSGDCTTQLLRSRGYAVGAKRLLELLRRAGFRHVQRRDGVLFQPVFIGVRNDAID